MEKTPSEKANFVVGFMIGASLTAFLFFAHRAYKKLSDKSEIKTESSDNTVDPMK